MNHLEYYTYQAKARGVSNPEHVRQQAAAKAFVYDRIVLPWLLSRKDGKMADLACGHGSFMYWMKTKGIDQVLGVDASIEQVMHARSVGLEVAHSDVFDWLQQQQANTHSVLFAMDFIEHISKDDMMRFLEMAHRILQPGGLLILRYPNGDSPLVGLNLFNDITHVWTYTTNCLRSLAEMHGFSRIRFADEGFEVMRDNRRLKLPFARLCAFVLRSLVQSVSRERVVYWNSSIWAALQK
jgi:2-polyprenyl-3-methyl-5-hydroxy-6-metoxy-1,4-benzoquinol methylase